jgi:uncharacterized protein YaaQ
MITIQPKEEISKQMLIAVVQAQDADVAESAICEMNISITRLPSTGAFLGHRNATLLIGLPNNKLDAILKAFKENCRQRVEYIAVPLESAPLPLPSPTPITVGGATIFSLEVEHFEEL